MPFAPATSVTKSNASKAIIRRTAMFLKELRNGAPVYIRLPYDNVEYDRAHQASGAKVMETYYQPRGGILRPNPAGTGYAEIGTDSTTSVEEVYDAIEILDNRDPNAPLR